MPAPKHIEELLKNIPQKAGIYQYYDKSDTLLYIGKAKNLKKGFPPILQKNKCTVKPRF